MTGMDQNSEVLNEWYTIRGWQAFSLQPGQYNQRKDLLSLFFKIFQFMILLQQFLFLFYGQTFHCFIYRHSAGIFELSRERIDKGVHYTKLIFGLVDKIKDFSCNRNAKLMKRTSSNDLGS